MLAANSVRVIGRGLASGLVTRAFGGSGGFWSGNFLTGLTAALAMAAVAEAAQDVYQHFAYTTTDGKPRAFLDPATKDAEYKESNAAGVAKVDGTQYGCTACNNFGQAQGLDQWPQEGGTVSTIAAKIPGFNSWAYLHDSIMAGQASWSTFTLTATIIPAGVVNWVALSDSIRQIQQNSELACTFQNVQRNKC
jgi:hypothetical protein